jgi:hypothetical protein
MTEEPLTCFGGPFSGEWPPEGLPDNGDYHTFWQTGDQRGDCALYDVVGLSGFFVGFHRE